MATRCMEIGVPNRRKLALAYDIAIRANNPRSCRWSLPIFYSGIPIISPVARADHRLCYDKVSGDIDVKRDISAFTLL